MEEPSKKRKVEQPEASEPTTMRKSAPAESEAFTNDSPSKSTESTSMGGSAIEEPETFTDDSPLKSTLTSLRRQLQIANHTKPWCMTITDISEVQARLDHKLALLMFSKTIEKAAFGASLQRIVEAFESCHTDEDEEPSSVCTFSEFWIDLDKKGKAKVPEKLHNAVTVLAGVSDDPCGRLAKMCTADQLTSICAAFTPRPVGSVSVDELCDVIEFLAEHGVTDATRCKNMEAFHKCEEWLDSWLKQHPEVAQYLDPSLVYVEAPAGAAIPVGLSDIIGTLPVGPGALAGAVGPLALPGGARSANLLTVASLGDAASVSIALRSHFANPVGGGGAGPALCVGRFSTASAAGVVFV